MLSSEELRDEVEIVWLEDTSRYRYVREGIYLGLQARGRPRSPGRLVGYANLVRRNRHREAVPRRIFYVMPHDASEDPRGVYGDGGQPCEAVRPASVKVGVPGRG